MTHALLVSNAVLWVVVLVLAVVILALVRQIGVLYERVAPAGALMMPRGPAIGDQAPVVTVENLAGGARDIGARRDDQRSTLLFFLSPTCPVCKTLLPALRSAARAERGWLDVLLASDGPRTEHETFVRAESLESFPYILSTTLGVSYQVSKLPYAVLLDGQGIVRAKGLVNTREHLESLFEAKERGLASVQDYLGRRRHGDGADGAERPDESSAAETAAGKAGEGARL
jgi:methylamine dehydrogenase accessory protein MauD